MNKSDLKQGALVQTRNENAYILIGKKFVNLRDGGYMPLEKYNEDLLTRYSEYDVMKVLNSSFENHGYHTYINNRRYGYPLKWTWERKEEEPRQ